MPGPWNTNTERMLLLCIIDPKATPKWDRVAARMGPRFSGEACRQKFYKLRNESASVGADAGSASVRPNKRKRKTQRSVNDQAQYDDTDGDDADAGARAPVQLISDRPFNKKHREDQRIQPHQDDGAVEETPSKGSKAKEEVKQEGIDKAEGEYASGSEYAPGMA